MIQRISNYMVVRISDALKLEKERIDVIAYGAFGVLQFVGSVILVVIPAVVLGVLSEAMVISFTAAILRKSSGGAHATSPGRCAVIGMLVFTGMALIIKAIPQNTEFIYCIIYSAACIISAYTVVYRHAPVDTPSKPITKNEMIKRLRKASFITLHIYLAIMVILTAIAAIHIDSLTIRNMLLSIVTGMLWQIITLTSVGHYVITNIDMFMKKMSVKVGGENV
jgi:accessory gene regulator B